MKNAEFKRHYPQQRDLIVLIMDALYIQICSSNNECDRVYICTEKRTININIIINVFLLFLTEFRN